MLDEIYLRLLLEILPANLKLSSWDINRLLEKSHDDDSTGRIYADLIRQLYQDDPDSNIGLRFGQHLRPATLCDYSRALMTASRFRDVLKIITQYQYLHGASYFPSVHVADEHISVALTYPFKEEISATQRRFCAESVFSYIMNTLRETVSVDIQPRALCLDYAAPSYASDYLRQFRCPLQYKQPLALLVLDRSLLDRNLSTANTTMHPIYLNTCLDQWRRSPRQRDIQYRAMTQLMHQAPDAFTSQNLAKQLNISVRGLQKRLSKHKESFSQLTARARRELAKIYLYQKRESLEATAEKLGFQTASGFRRFFKTEFGMTPAEFLEVNPN